MDAFNVTSAEGASIESCTRKNIAPVFADLNVSLSTKLDAFAGAQLVSYLFLLDLAEWDGFPELSHVYLHPFTPRTDHGDFGKLEGLRAGLTTPEPLPS